MFEFALASVVAVLLIGFVGVLVLKGESRTEALNDARELTRLAGRGIVQPVVTDALVAGDPAARARVDQVVRSAVLGRGIARVKIWTPQGRLVYSDAPLPVAFTERLHPSELASLGSGAVVVDEHTNPARPYNRFERPLGPLLEIYLPIHTPSGQPLLFEGYQPSGEVSASARHLWVTFAPALFGGLAVLALVLLPLAWSLASRLRRREQERVALLARTVQASEDERRRIASDLHDGVVQDLAGVALSLASSSETVADRSPAHAAGLLAAAAGQTRQSIRALRSLLVDIYPPSLREEGLERALSDLIAGLTLRGVQTQLNYEPGVELSEDQEALLYRVAQEAVRNAAAHADARQLEVTVAEVAEGAALTVRDDGVGFPSEKARERKKEGHVGLSLLDDFVRDHGGRLHVTSEPEAGTTVTVEVDHG